MYVARTPYTRTPADTPSAVAVRLAEQSIKRLSAAILTDLVHNPADPADRAARALRLEQLYARQARWWTILSRATDIRWVPCIYIDAAIRAGHKAQESARFWRDTAADWTARALDRPTSDCAGAMSNWEDLGVTDLGRPHLAETVPPIGAGR